MKQLFKKKWLIAMLVFILIGSATPVFLSETSQAGVPPWRVIKNVNSGKVLGIGGTDKQSNGAHVVQWQREYVMDQHWYIVNTGDGYVYFKNVASGLYLDVNGASSADGATVIQWTKNDGWNQQWKLIQANTSGQTSYYIQNRGSGKYLEIAEYSTSNGSQAIQWSLNTGSNQRWFIDYN
ncbi:RICIN domain-containing protein [Paenibacillus yanchengensis]|uniref:RICIN domain-containing protein n=1 Tax=Paenibacillus yanchengensis TaxID=2035833 RepID=A0ABW4YML4_9BACL